MGGIRRLSDSTNPKGNRGIDIDNRYSVIGNYVYGMLCGYVLEESVNPCKRSSRYMGTGLMVMHQMTDSCPYIDYTGPCIPCDGTNEGFEIDEKFDTSDAEVEL